MAVFSKGLGFSVARYTRFGYDGNQLTRAPVFVAAIVTVILSVTAVVVVHAIAVVTLELVAPAAVT